MDHPNIAKVFDAGIDAGPVDQPLEDTHHDSAGPIPSRDADLRSTRASRPYVVMERIEGESITQYCDSGRMSPRSPGAVHPGLSCRAARPSEGESFTAISSRLTSFSDFTMASPCQK